MAKKSKTEFESTVTGFQQLYIVYILKHRTKAGKPDTYLSALDMVRALNELCVSVFDDNSKKTIDAKLRRLSQTEVPEDFDEAEEIAIDDFYSMYLPAALGGFVRCVTDENHKQGKNLYYFEPFLKEEDASLAVGTLASSRYLSDYEKDYLMSSIRSLSSLDAIPKDYKDREKEEKDGEIGAFVYDEEDYIEIPQRPFASIRKADGSLPGSRNIYLDNVTVLFEAIRDHVVIEAEYGKYDFDLNTDSHLVFKARKSKKRGAYNTYLNPYAMFWNSGQHYLLATHYNADDEVHHRYNNPVIYRVDRFIQVKKLLNAEIDPVSKNDENDKYVKWDGYPAALEAYFSGEVFDRNRYVSEHPTQAIMFNSEDKFVEECVLRTTIGALSIIADYFGTSGERVRVRKTGEMLKEDKEYTEVFEVTLKHIQYNCLKQFCVQHLGSMTVVSPEKFRETVKKEIAKITERYED